MTGRAEEAGPRAHGQTPDAASAPTGTRHRLTGTISVELPPEAAFRLFTPAGEREWVDGWEPRFPASADDDTVPGTVFETAAHGRVTTWIVLAREPGRAISYARVTPGERAGTVSVILDRDGAGSRVTVTYELTSLTPEARDGLRAFAAGYGEYLNSWEGAIAAAVTRR